MKSQTSDVFWKHYRTLPLDVRRRAREAYKLWSKNPRQPSLFFKRVREDRPLYSVRIGLAYRALGILEDDTITWVWIGHHSEYDRLVK